MTGGGTGIGRALAIGLAEAGADVALSGRSSATIDAVKGEIESMGRRSLAIVADVRVKDDVDRTIDTIVEEWGRLDIGVNNAGVGQWVATDELTEDDWDTVLDTNLKGPYLCSQAQARVMIPQGHGKIINNASMSARIVNRPQNQMPYNTSKAGLVHMTRSLAAEWAPHGIYVNSLSPGYTRTEMADAPEKSGRRTRSGSAIHLWPHGRGGRHARRADFSRIRRFEFRNGPRPGCGRRIHDLVAAPASR